MKYGFGVDLGGTTVKIAYFDETGNMLEKWAVETCFTYPGAIQYFGPTEVCDLTTHTLALEKA